MEQDTKKVHLFAIIYITIQWYIDNDTIDSSEILRTNQCWGIYPTIHSFYFFPIAFLSNLKVRDIAFCLPKHFLFQNTRVYRLMTCVLIGLFSWTQAPLLAKIPSAFAKWRATPPRASKRPRWFQLLQWKTSGFSLPKFHIDIAAIALQSDLPNRKVGNFHFQATIF